MINVRKGLYETNSSSVHTLVISNRGVSVPSVVDLVPGDYAFFSGEITDMLSYVWTYYLAKRREVQFIEWLYDIGVLEVYVEGVLIGKTQLENLEINNRGAMDSYNLDTLERDVFSDLDLVKRLLFGSGSYVYGGTVGYFDHIPGLYFEVVDEEDLEDIDDMDDDVVYGTEEQFDDAVSKWIKKTEAKGYTVEICG